jgi:glycyl-tRNA synthetase beta chain
MAGCFLLEVGSDEIPARYLPGAIEGLRSRAAEALREARLSFREVRTYGTPRRLVLLVDELAGKSSDAVALVRGPSKKAAYDAGGNPTKALLGFCRSIGIDPGDAIVKDDNGSEYVYGEKFLKGRPVKELLPEILPDVVMGLECPYPMRWGDENWRWFRPIRWIVCLYDKEVVPVTIAGRTAVRVSWGHRTLHPREVTIESAGGYLSSIAEAFVEVDPAARTESIVREARNLAAAVGGEPVIDDELLSEVSSMAEHPAAFLGRFDERYLRLPVEVLMTSMRRHQRYFPVVGKDGGVRPAFIGVRDGDPSRGIDTVRKGNEWVLRARLEDAGFFYEQDTKITLADRIRSLQGIRFVRNAGSMYDKSQRMRRIAEYLGRTAGLSPGDLEAASQAALLAKADLATAMVREFPELEGIMGGTYALLEGVDPGIARAISQHYQPKGAKDRVPDKGAPSMVALADKLDSLAVSFSLGIEVTGSQDPLGLRRSALGVVAIIAGHGYDFTMDDLLSLPLELAKEVVKEPSASAEDKMESFITARVEAMLAERGYPVEVIRAVLGGTESRIARAEARASALAALLYTDDLAALVAGWKRIGVLAKGAESRRVDEALLKDEAEIRLYRAVLAREHALLRSFESRDYRAYLTLLVELKPFIDSCLDEVLIMAEEPSLRFNRLALLGLVAECWSKYADFSMLKSLSPSG